MWQRTFCCGSWAARKPSTRISPRSGLAASIFRTAKPCFITKCQLNTETGLSRREPSNCVALHSPRENAVLQKQTTLNLNQIYRCGAFLVVVGCVIDASAYGIAPHQPSVERFQMVRCLIYVRHSRIEP